MAKNMIILGQIVQSGVYTTDIKLAAELANDIGQTVILPDDFSLDTTSITLAKTDPVGNPAINTNAVVRLEFGGSNGRYAKEVIRKSANFVLENTGEPAGKITITVKEVGDTYVDWNVQNDTAETIDFAISSVANFDSFYGYDIATHSDPNHLEITWTSEEG